MILAVGRRLRRAHRAGDQHRALRHQRRDLRQRVGLARQQERKRRFRPDQMRDVAHAGRLRTGRAVRQFEIVGHHALLGAVVELLVLLQVGLHDAQPHLVDECGRRAVQPQRAVARQRREQHHAERERQPGPPRVGAIVGEHSGAREHRDRDEGQPPDADQRSALRQHQRPGQRIAIDVPGKSAEQMAAQPFRGGERERERDQPARPARPEQPRQREAEAGVAGHAGRQRDDRERQQPAEGLGVDQECVADPIKTGEEIAEAEPPAGDRRARQSAAAAGRRAVDQPHQDREREEQHRPGIERRQRQRRQRARRECHQRAPPAPAQHDPVREAREGRRPCGSFDRWSRFLRRVGVGGVRRRLCVVGRRRDAVVIWGAL